MTPKLDSRMRSWYVVMFCIGGHSAAVLCIFHHLHWELQELWKLWVWHALCAPSLVWLHWNGSGWRVFAEAQLTPSPGVVCWFSSNYTSREWESSSCKVHKKAVQQPHQQCRCCKCKIILFCNFNLLHTCFPQFPYLFCFHDTHISLSVLCGNRQ